MTELHSRSEHIAEWNIYIVKLGLDIRKKKIKKDIKSLATNFSPTHTYVYIFFKSASTNAIESRKESRR